MSYFYSSWSVTQSCLTLCDPMDCSMLNFPVSQSLLKFMPIESVMPSNHLILCHTLILLPSILPNIRVFSNESALHIRWPAYCSFSISPSNGYSGLISFRMDWFDLLAVQVTLKSLLQYHSSKVSIRKLPQVFYPYISISTSILFFILSSGIYKYNCSHSIYVHIIYICVCVCIYIYIYI